MEDTLRPWPFLNPVICLYSRWRIRAGTASRRHIRPGLKCFVNGVTVSIVCFLLVTSTETFLPLGILQVLSDLCPDPLTPFWSGDLQVTNAFSPVVADTFFFSTSATSLQLCLMPTPPPFPVSPLLHFLSYQSQWSFMWRWMPSRGWAPSAKGSIVFSFFCLWMSITSQAGGAKEAELGGYSDSGGRRRRGGSGVSFP